MAVPHRQDKDVPSSSDVAAGILKGMGIVVSVVFTVFIVIAVVVTIFESVR